MGNLVFALQGQQSCLKAELGLRPRPYLRGDYPSAIQSMLEVKFFLLLLPLNAPCKVLLQRFKMGFGEGSRASWSCLGTKTGPQICKNNTFAT